MKQSTRAKQRKSTRQKRGSNKILILLAVIAALALAGWYLFSQVGNNATASHTHGEAAEGVDHVHGENAELPHIHGMGYTEDGSQLVVAAHDGLRIYVDGEWLVPNVPVNDYMGYSPVDEGFYSSGHPGTGSRLPNPLGLVKSTDGGKTLTTLGFSGESDFHLMAAGYRSHAVYVLNPTPNARLGVGLFYTLDDGETWQQSALQGLVAQPLQIAVHPAEPNIVALATEAGLLLSTDFDDTFKLVGGQGSVTAAAFTPDGERLLFGYQTLQAYDLATREVLTLEAPDVASDDGLAYVAINPQDENEIAVATFQRHLFISEDGGESWKQVARAGKGL